MRDLERNLTGLDIQLGFIARNLDKLMRDVGFQAIERHSLIRKLFDALRNSEHLTSWEEWAEQLADKDLEMKRDLDRIDHDLFEAKAVRLAPIIEACEELINSRAGIAKELEQEQFKSKSLSLRLREHAPDNASVRDAVWRMTGGKCFYCDVQLVKEGSLDSPGRLFQVDHIVAKANGGPDHISNYAPSCEQCNASKSDKHIVEFVRKRAQLTVIEGGKDEPITAAR